MKTGNIVAYENGLGNFIYAEIIDSEYTYWNGEKGITVMPFGDNLAQYLFESDCWLLADNL
jgi:hypothetical protein